MPKKNLAKLTPVKKNVIDKRTDTPVERTYYIDPDKNKHKEREHAAKEEQSSGKIKEEENTQSKNKSTLKPKEKQGLDIEKIKNFDDFGRQGVDPAAAKQFFCNM